MVTARWCPAAPDFGSGIPRRGHEISGYRRRRQQRCRHREADRKDQTIELKADFLNYLLVRNKFVRSQPRINVAQEDIIAAPGDPIVDVTLVLSIPCEISSKRLLP